MCVCHSVHMGGGGSIPACTWARRCIQYAPGKRVCRGVCTAYRNGFLLSMSLLFKRMNNCTSDEKMPLVDPGGVPNPRT